MIIKDNCVTNSLTFLKSMKPPSTGLIFTLLLTFLHHHETLAGAVGGGAAHTTPDIIAKACSRTLHKDFCIASLSSNPEAKNAKDIVGIAVVAMKLTKSNATSISNHINKLLNANPDNFIGDCLTDCAEGYGDAIGLIDDSLTAMETKDYNDAQTWMSAAMSDADSCEQGFKEQAGKKSPLTQMNEVYSKLCSSVLAIINVLKGGP